MIEFPKKIQDLKFINQKKYCNEFILSERSVWDGRVIPSDAFGVYLWKKTITVLKDTKKLFIILFKTYDKLRYTWIDWKNGFTPLLKMFPFAPRKPIYALRPTFMPYKAYQKYDVERKLLRARF